MPTTPDNNNKTSRNNNADPLDRLTLEDRVSFAIDDNYKTKQEKQKRKKCSECGKGFLGQDGASTCGPKCRMRKSRKG